MTNPKEETMLIEMLRNENIISKEQLAHALEIQKNSKNSLAEILFQSGYITSETNLSPAIASALGIEIIRLRDLSISKDVIQKIPPKFALHYKIIPTQYEKGVLSIATTKPFNMDVLEGLTLICPAKIKFYMASEKEIIEAIRQFYGVGADTIDQMMDTISMNPIQEKIVENIEEIESEASIGKFINQILLEAYRQRATDIHLEPFENELQIRYRVDGVLYDTHVPSNIWHFKDSINSRIKIMSNLNIAERRLPQDGRFKVKVNEIDLDLRVSFLPTSYGEGVVIRLLPSTKFESLEDLGLSKDDLIKLDLLIKKPHGIIFVTGPTGSGKTTTLYTCLSQVNSQERKILTIEDPIEYLLKGITQIQVNPNIGLSFSQGLRSMLRHDPDIMMVGEVRDFETADIAIRIALTGHLVLSTLHTNDAASGVTRLIDMGIAPYLIVSSVDCFIAQRLIRLICPKCKTLEDIPPDLNSNFDLSVDEKIKKIYTTKGCEYCNFTGYFGREGIYEFLFLNEEIKEMILARASAHQIKSKAIELGMKTLLQHGWDKVKEGLTSPSEILRVTKEDQI